MTWTRGSFLRAAPILERFPQARGSRDACGSARHAEPARVEVDRQLLAEALPGQIPDRLLAAEPPPSKVTFELEGQPLIAVDAGRTDTEASSSLHVPSLDLIVAGDVVYNGIHPFLAETSVQSRAEWIAALDRLEKLKPYFVVAGQKVPENDDDPADIARTRRYLRDFDVLNQATTTALELYDAMLERYPDRANPEVAVVWRSRRRSRLRKVGSSSIMNSRAAAMVFAPAHVQQGNVAQSHAPFLHRRWPRLSSHAGPAKPEARCARGA